MEFDLEYEILSWINKYGEQRISKKYGTEFLVIPIKRREELFRHLVQNLCNKGKDKEYFRDNVVDIIAKSCLPPVDVVSDILKYKRSMHVVRMELEFVIAEFFYPFNKILVYSWN